MKYYNLKTGSVVGNQLTRSQLLLRSGLVALALIIIGLVLIFLDIRRGGFGSVVKVSQQSNDGFQVFTSQYFSFRATNKWVFDEASSSETLYRYILRNGASDRGYLEVMVNHKSIPELLNAQQVVVFTQNPESLDISESSVSPQCSTFTEPLRTTINVNVSFAKYQDAEFQCEKNNTNPKVSAALAGGTDAMELLRPNGSTAVYRLRYQELSSETLTNNYELPFSSFKAL